MKTLFIFFLSVFLVACGSKKRITNDRDYTSYLDKKYTSEEVKKTIAEILFWSNKLYNDTSNYVYKLELARHHLKLFRTNGNIVALQKGDSLLHRSSEKLNDSDPELLFALSQNNISLHRFLQAAAYNEKAEKANGDLYTSRLLEFDAAMELGQFARAGKSLKSLKDKTAFDFLIRRAKWEDHQGNLDKAIQLMEQAFGKIKHRNNSLYVWSLSNLADMYSHAGRIKEAYQAYLDVLRKDPGNIYCLKGIAWIAFSHDGNTAAAKKILQYILSQAAMPELKLILAEIAEAENNQNEQKKWVKEFISDVTAKEYGGMYNKYLINIYCEELNDFGKATELAKREIDNRFTPETCDWLAWVNYQMGNYDEAYKLARGYVYQFTHEPEALMHSGFIFAAKGMKNEARKLLEECLGSSFELGPAATKRIKEKLKLLK